VDVAGHPVALLRRGEPLGLQGVVAQLLVGRGERAAGFLLPAQQLTSTTRNNVDPTLGSSANTTSASTSTAAT